MYFCLHNIHSFLGKGAPISFKEPPFHTIPALSCDGVGPKLDQPDVPSLAWECEAERHKDFGDQSPAQGRSL